MIGNKLKFRSTQKLGIASSSYFVYSPYRFLSIFSTVNRHRMYIPFQRQNTFLIFADFLTQFPYSFAVQTMAFLIVLYGNFGYLQ